MNNQGYSNLKYYIDKERDIYFIIPKKHITQRGSVRKSIMSNIKKLNIKYLEDNDVICNNIKKLVDCRRKREK